MSTSKHSGFISHFIRHRVAANLLMAAMVIAGLLATSRLNTQFFPTFEAQIVTIRTVWSGAAAEDVRQLLTIPIEQAVRNVDSLDKMTSISRRGLSLITLKFPEDADMARVIDKVQEQVNTIRNLPQDAERAIVARVLQYEPIAALLVHGDTSLDELRPLVRTMENQLLARGIARVDITGLPDEEIAIQFPAERLEEIGLSLEQLTERIAAASADHPAGTIGRNEGAREIRSLQQRRDILGFESLPLLTEQNGQLVRVGDLADIERRPVPDSVTLTHRGKVAVELLLERSAGTDSLHSARILDQWLAETRPKLPKGIEITVYDENWRLIAERIEVLVSNGISGLVLVMIVLFLFINSRVALWVSVGIVVSFLATLGVLYLVGGSINMISLFAFIMALGIIVDDAIVVGEDSLVHLQQGSEPATAPRLGAQRMLIPVLAASLTTIAAFAPLLTIEGVIGNILRDIPIVIIAVILASLVECFLVLPGHLRQSFAKSADVTAGEWRQRLDAAFEHFKEKRFRPWLKITMANKPVPVVITLGLALMVAGLIKGERLGFTFFPSVEGNIMIASASFVAGTPAETVEEFIAEVEAALYKADETHGGGLVHMSEQVRGIGYAPKAELSNRGDPYASVITELVTSDRREVRNETFLATWESLVERTPGLENLTFTSRTAGHPGRDIEVRLTGGQLESLKTAAESIQNALDDIPGVYAIEDDLPYGPRQLVLELTPLGEVNGLSVASVARQLRAALDGHLVQIFNDNGSEIEVRTMLSDEQRHSLATLEDMIVFLPNGATAPLASVVEWQERRGFRTLHQANGELAVTVFANVDPTLNNANTIREQLATNLLADITSNHGVDWSFTGQASDQRDTAGDMLAGAIMAIVLIYLVLAWVFESYLWPLVVMVVIPFGLVGALLGHWVMGIMPTILSMFGLFALAGIMVNNSIILITFYRDLRASGLSVDKAIIEATCQRLRAVLLTSLTTIGGLLPLLFETSLQAQFLIPMAVSITFGLAFGTLLVLFLVPVLLSVIERYGATKAG